MPEFLVSMLVGIIVSIIIVVSILTINLRPREVWREQEHFHPLHPHLPYITKEFDLSNLRNREEIKVSGDWLGAYTNGSLDEIFVDFDDATLIPLGLYNPIIVHWDILYLTHKRLPNKRLHLFIRQPFSEARKEVLERQKIKQ